MHYACMTSALFMLCLCFTYCLLALLMHYLCYTFFLRYLCITYALLMRYFCFTFALRYVQLLKLRQTVRVLYWCITYALLMRSGTGSLRSWEGCLQSWSPSRSMAPRSAHAPHTSPAASGTLLLLDYCFYYCFTSGWLTLSVHTHYLRREGR